MLNAKELTYILSTKEIDILKHLLDQNYESDIHNAQFYRENKFITTTQYSSLYVWQWANQTFGITELLINICIETNPVVR